MSDSHRPPDPGAPRPGPVDHLDLDALADVLAGERDDAHLRTCRHCTDRLGELAAADASVAGALGGLPAPPLPDGLSARLAQALQEERRREVATVRPLRRRPPSWLPAAAASAVLVMAGAAGWSLLDAAGPGGSDQSASDAGAGGSESHGGGGDDGGGGGGGGPEPAAPEAAAGLAVPRAAAPTDWADAAARPAALSRLLTAADAAATATAPVPAAEGLDRLRDPAALDACLAALPGGDAGVLAVDYTQHAGAPAVAVVQDAAPGSVEVTVVGSGCSADDPQVLLEVLLPRP